MLEADVEKYLVAEVARRGGVAEKMKAIGTRGFFDRLLVLPGGRVIFVELKRPARGRLSMHQKLRHNAYVRLGAEVYVVASIEAVDVLMTLIDRPR